jgi:hypothetical protein
MLDSIPHKKMPTMTLIPSVEKSFDIMQNQNKQQKGASKMSLNPLIMQKIGSKTNASFNDEKE